MIQKIYKRKFFAFVFCLFFFFFWKGLQKDPLSTGSSPDGSNSQFWAILKSELGVSFRFLTWVAVTQIFGSYSTAFLGYLQPGFKLEPLWDCWHYNQWLCLLNHISPDQTMTVSKLQKCDTHSVENILWVWSFLWASEERPDVGQLSNMAPTQSCVP